MMTHSTRTRRGFTILELLVVIFIMMVMTGIAVAAFRQFLDTERIKLAGGQIVSAVRMARQYAMSKRIKVMAELVEPEVEIERTEVEVPVEMCYSYEKYPDNNYPGLDYIMQWQLVHRDGYVKYDLSELKTILEDGGGLVGAELYFKSDNVSYPYPAFNPYLKVGTIADDTWDPALVTWNNAPTVTGSLDNIYQISNGKWVSLNVTDHVRTEIEGDGFASFRFQSNFYAMRECSTKMVVTLEKDVTDYELNETLPRHLRIIPYLRMHNTTTGGFNWVLDDDSNALKFMALPRNIRFALAPGKSSVVQYDPGNIVDHQTNATKIGLNLNPDGTCDSVSPSVEGWEHRQNTIIIRDLSTGDLGLLYVPASSSSVRQRYLFGDEVEEFEAAYSDCALW